MRQWTQDQTFILVCKKCGKKLSSNEDGDPARALAKTLKRVCKPLLGKKNFRVLMTSCLKLCPKGQISVAVLGSNKPSKLMTVKPGEAEEAAGIIQSFLKPQNVTTK